MLSRTVQWYKCQGGENKQLIKNDTLGSGRLGGASPIFLVYGAESADLNEWSLRARHAKARLRARGHLKSFDTTGFGGGVSKFFMTLNGWDFRCV